LRLLDSSYVTTKKALKSILLVSQKTRQIIFRSPRHCPDEIRKSEVADEPLFWLFTTFAVIST